MASNSTGITDEAAEFEDWVELHNTGASAVDIGGFYVTDDTAEPQQWQIPTSSPVDTTIAPGGYLILWFDKNTADGVLHVDAKLGSDGEEIGIYDASGVVVDTHAFGAQTADVSEGRETDGASNYVVFTVPSPGAANVYTPPTASVEDPVFDQPSGVLAAVVDVTLTSATAGAVVYYTTDGSDPDSSSAVASGPITVTSPTVIRSRAYLAGLSPSAIVTRSYLVGVSHDFPIVSVSAHPDVFYDEDIGLFPNTDEDVELPANVELYETDGSLAFSQIAETELQGSASLGYDQKSLAFKAKGSLGNPTFDYALFPDLPYSSYKSFIIRNSGQDWWYLRFRDAYLSGLIHDTTDVNDLIIQPDVDTQAFRPAIAYINGEYYGILNLRERIDWRYLDTHYGLDDSQIDLIEGFQENKEGDLDAWNDLINFVTTTDLSVDANFDAVREMIDIESYIDYHAFQIYIKNGDWPANNVRRWRERSPDGQWRWLLYDLDISASMNSGGDPSALSLNRLMNPDIDASSNPAWASELFRSLMTSASFRAELANRTADMTNALFPVSRTSSRLADLVSLYANERDIHADVWASGWNPTNNSAADLDNFFSGRADVIYADFAAEIAEVTGTADVTLDVNPAGTGSIQFNTMIPAAARLPYTGTYFTGIGIPTLARGERGYVLDSWSDASMVETEASATVLTGDLNLTANFVLGSTAVDDIVINEINYKSSDTVDPGDWVELHNPTSADVDISGWYFEDESGEYFGMPANTVIPAGGYLVLAENLGKFQSVYTSVSNVLGPMEFGLKAGGEELVLSNAAGTVIDSVEYDRDLPWPVTPNGEGDTAQLTDPTLDNGDAASWIGDAPSPGGVNGTPVLPGGGSSSGGSSSSSTGGSTSSTGGTTSSTGGSTSSTGGTTSSTGGSTSSSGSSSSGGGADNDSPDMSYPGTQDTDAGVPISLQIVVTDTENDPLTFSATGLPSGLAIDPVTGLISGVIDDTGGYSVSVTVEDPYNSPRTVYFWWSAYSFAPGTGSSGGSSTSSTGGSTSSTGGSTSSTSSTGGSTSSTSSTGGSTSSTGGSTSSSSSSSSGGGGSNDSPDIDYPGTQDTDAGIPINLQIVVTDTENDPLTFSASGLPTGLNIDAVTGLISGIITDTGGYSASVTVEDSYNSPRTVYFWWSAYSFAPGTGSSSSGGSTSSTGGSTSSTGGSTSSTGGSTSSSGSSSSSSGGGVDNRSPVLDYPGTQDTDAGVPISLQLVVTDAENDPVTFSASGLPEGLDIDPNTGLISGTITDTGGYSVSVTYQDQFNDPKTINFWWSAYSFAP